MGLGFAEFGSSLVAGTSHEGVVMLAAFEDARSIRPDRLATSLAAM